MKKGFMKNLYKWMNEVDAELVRNAMKRYKFTKKQWLVFDLQNGSTAVGYTTIKNSQQIIVSTSNAGESGVLPFNKIINPRILCIDSQTVKDIRQFVTELPDTYINFTNGKA